MNASWWWIDRWQKSTAYKDMTLEEQGAYRNLLDECWLREGALPNDDRVLAKMCGDSTAWERVRKAVMARFTLRADGWHNDTHDSVAKESHRRAEKQKAYRRRRKAGNATGNAGGNKRVNVTHSPSPAEETEKHATAAALEGPRGAVLESDAVIDASLERGRRMRAELAPKIAAMQARNGTQ